LKLFHQNLMINPKILVAIAIGFVAILTSAESFADVYVYKDKQGVLTFTNVPNHSGYRRVLKRKRRPSGRRIDGRCDLRGANSTGVRPP
jgi:hypothetical protein